MSPVRSVVVCVRKYSEFSGRASRSEYWWWTLLAVIAGVVVTIAELVTVSTVLSVAVWVPASAVMVRRLHDTGRSGTYVFRGLGPLAGAFVLTVVPVIGWVLAFASLIAGLIGGIMVIVALASKGDPRDNTFGPAPGSADQPQVAPPGAVSQGLGTPLPTALGVLGGIGLISGPFLTWVEGRGALSWLAFNGTDLEWPDRVVGWRDPWVFILGGSLLAFLAVKNPGGDNRNLLLGKLWLAAYLLEYALFLRWDISLLRFVSPSGEVPLEVGTGVWLLIAGAGAALAGSLHGLSRLQPKALATSQATPGPVVGDASHAVSSPGRTSAIGELRRSFETDEPNRQ